MEDIQQTPQLPDPQIQQILPSQAKKKFPRYFLFFLSLLFLILAIAFISTRLNLQQMIKTQPTRSDFSTSPKISNTKNQQPESIQIIQAPQVNKLVFKSDTEEYLKYKFIEYDILTGQVKDIPFQMKIDINARFGVANSLKHCSLATEEALYTCPAENPQLLTKVFSIQSENTPTLPRERISTLNTKWSQDGSQLLIQTEKYFSSGSREIKLYTAKPDGTNLHNVKTITTDKLHVVQAYDSTANSLFHYFFSKDARDSDRLSEIVNTENGEVKGEAAFINDKGIVDDIIFSPDMNYAFYRKRSQDVMQLIQYDLKTDKERILYTFDKEGGTYLLSIPTHLLIVADLKLGKMQEVKLFDYESGKEEVLYSGSQNSFMPISFSPDGRYFLAEDSRDYEHPSYAIYDVKKRTLNTISIPPAMKVKRSALEKVYWLP